MLRSLSILVLIISMPAVAWSANAVRSAGNFGIGLGAGTFATGISMKYFLQQSLSIQGNVGWWRGTFHRFGKYRYYYGGGDNSLALSADLLFEQPSFAGNQAVKVAWEIGGGIGLGLEELGNDVGLGATFVIGIEINIDAAPVDVVLEYRPGFYVLPRFALDLINITGHIRYYF
ncbi:hypothetical protein ACFL6C_12775 [Myxococcota bacterium]